MGVARMALGAAAKLDITGIKKLCSLAEGFGLNCEIGAAGNALVQAANLHVIFFVDNCDIYECWMPQSAHQFGLVEDIVLNERCAIDAPTSPSLGYEIDWAWVGRRHKATLEQRLLRVPSPCRPPVVLKLPKALSRRREADGTPHNTQADRQAPA